jgi:hypothetical protein
MYLLLSIIRIVGERANYHFLTVNFIRIGLKHYIFRYVARQAVDFKGGTIMSPKGFSTELDAAQRIVLI